MFCKGESKDAFVRLFKSVHDTVKFLYDTEIVPPNCNSDRALVIKDAFKEV